MTNAPDFLIQAAALLQQRGKDYDKPEGERSVATTCRAFNAITGALLTEEQGWTFLLLLKLVRANTAPGFHRDSYEDAVAYAALTAEAAYNGAKEQEARDLAQAAKEQEDQIMDPLVQLCRVWIARAQADGEIIDISFNPNLNPPLSKHVLHNVVHDTKPREAANAGTARGIYEALLQDITEHEK